MIQIIFWKIYNAFLNNQKYEQRLQNLLNVRSATIPNDYDLSKTEFNVVHLSNEDRTHSFIQRSPVHINGGSNREDESGHATVDVQGFLQATKRDR